METYFTREGIGRGESGKIISQVSIALFRALSKKFSGKDGSAPLEKIIVPYAYAYHTVYYWWRYACHRHVLNMMTVVNTPAVMNTISYRSLVTDTPHIVQPDLSAAWPIPSSNYFTAVSKINEINMTSLRLNGMHGLH